MARDLEQYVLDHFDTAIERHYITPYFQPVIRTISRKLCGFEALARWVDAGYGVIRPDQFIPVLEEHQLIHRLDICIIWQVWSRSRSTCPVWIFLYATFSGKWTMPSAFIRFPET